MNRACLVYLYNMKFLFITILSVYFLFGCKPSKPASTKQISCKGGEVLTLVNLVGLDGCGWVFEQANGTKLEPINLNDQLTTPEDKQYRVLYKTRTDGASICMVGSLVEIVCIEAIN